MPQPSKDNDYIPIPISDGILPDWQLRLGYPWLKNMFVGDSKACYCTPGLEKFDTTAPDSGARAVLESEFGAGSYFIVTNSAILQIFKRGHWKIISEIQDSGQSVQLTENLQNQVGIVDGNHFWVYDQKTSSLVLMGDDQGFEFKSPISIVSLNTFTVVLDRISKTWVVSDPNNMLSFPPLDNVPQIGDQLQQPISLQTLSDNLYIFGTQGIERWVPTVANNQYLFAFTKDVNFRKDFGAIGTNTVVRGFEEIFFLSSKFVPMSLSDGELKNLGPAGSYNGIARLISQYIDINNGFGSFYTYKSNYFYSLTFPISNINWTYCQNSNTWSFNEDNILSSVRSGEVVANKNGLYSLSLTPNKKIRQWRSKRVVNDKGAYPYRNSLNAAKARIVQGLLQNKEPQYLELSISKDSQNFGNIVRRPIGLTGERQHETTWKMNMTGQEFTFLLSYYGDMDLTIEGFSAIIR